MGFIFFCAISQLIIFWLMRFVDFWYIRDEFRKYFYLFGIGIVLVMTVSGSALLVDKSNNNGSIGYFNYQFITFVACTLFLLYFIYATKIIIIRNEYRSKKYKMKMQSYQNPHKSQSKIDINNNHEKETITTKFKAFVSEEGGYCELMTHITREFSTENLLFLTVLTHFQNFLMEFNYLRDNFEIIKQESFDIPPQIPKPPIIESQTAKLRERISREIQEQKAKLNADKLNSKRRSKSHADLIHHNIKKQLSGKDIAIEKPKRFSLHIKRNSDSLKKEALKQIFGLKKGSFKKLHEGTPSHSYDDPAVSPGVKGIFISNVQLFRLRNNSEKLNKTHENQSNQQNYP